MNDNVVSLCEYRKKKEERNINYYYIDPTDDIALSFILMMDKYLEEYNDYVDEEIHYVYPCDSES